MIIANDDDDVEMMLLMVMTLHKGISSMQMHFISLTILKNKQLCKETNKKNLLRKVMKGVFLFCLCVMKVLKKLKVLRRETIFTNTYLLLFEI